MKKPVDLFISRIKFFKICVYSKAQCSNIGDNK